MSRRVVRYEGEGRLRRAVYADEGPAAARTEGLAAMGRLSVLDIVSPTVPIEGAGPVERRRLGDAELAARLEPLPAPVARLVQPVTPPATQEKPVMTSQPQPIIQTATEQLRTLLEDLAAAAAALAAALDDHAAAQARLEEARLRFAAVVDATTSALPAGGSGPTGPAERPAGAESSREREMQGLLRLRSRGQTVKVAAGTTVARDRDRDQRAAAVLEALERHGGDRKAVATELGLRANVVAIIEKRARARAAEASA